MSKRDTNLPAVAGQSTVPAALAASAYVALRESPGDLIGSIAANVGGAITEFDLDRVHVPAGGGLTWEIPGLVPTSSREIVGVVVARHAARGYWARSLEASGGGTPPDCSSTDGITGVGNPGGPCITCPKNVFGSATRNGEQAAGKACKEQVLLFILREGDRLPIVVAVPPSSLLALRKYMLRLATASTPLPFWTVVTRLSLAQTKNKANGITYSSIVPEMVKALAPDESAAFRAYADVLAPSLASVARASLGDLADLGDRD